MYFFIVKIHTEDCTHIYTNTNLLFVTLFRDRVIYLLRKFCVQGGLAFSHLFFADDIVFFAKADLINCSTIWDVLDQFCDITGQMVSEAKSCDITGQMVSEAKSRVFFLPNVDRDTGESFSDILGMQSTPNLRQDLGIPIKSQGPSRQDFNFILERVK